MGQRPDAAPAAGVARPPGKPRFELLDGLRAVAALSVVALHTSVYTTVGPARSIATGVARSYTPGWPGAFAHQLAAGVTVFFLLTGFLLYRPFVVARIAGRSPVPMRDYARRRLLRIVPAYWLALTLLAIWPGLPGAPLGHDWWRYYGFLQDFSGHTLFDGIGTAWSLGTEVSFYLLLPFLALGLGRLTRGRSVSGVIVMELSVLAALSAGSLLLRLALWSSHPNLCYTILGTFDWFAIGMAVAVFSAAADHGHGVSRITQAIGRHPSLLWTLSFAAFSLAAAYRVWTGNYDGYSAGPLHLIWAAVALFLLLPAVFPRGHGGVPGRILSIRLLGWLGIISYGVYLWHLPLVPKVGGAASDLVGIRFSGVMLTAVLLGLVVAVAAGCAACSYYFVERPILRFKDGFHSRRDRPPVRSPSLPALSHRSEPVANRDGEL
jgi:peptidoglycan/LPS O-acetylase OafA/YrhL